MYENMKKNKCLIKSLKTSLNIYKTDEDRKFL